MSATPPPVSGDPALPPGRVPGPLPIPPADAGRPGDPAPEGFYRSRSGRLLPIVHEVSAGGLAVDLVGGQICAVIILRQGRSGRLEWLLPKGHVEAGETVAQAAAREVHEETGIECRPVRFLSSMDYWFSGTDRRVHKVVHHFLLEATGGELSVEGDPDHEARTAQWVGLGQLQQRLAFPAERRIAQLAMRLLKGRVP